MFDMYSSEFPWANFNLEWLRKTVAQVMLTLTSSYWDDIKTGG